MRRTEWLKAMVLAVTALAPAVTAQDSGNDTKMPAEGESSDMQMDLLLGLPQCAVSGHQL